MADIRYLHLYPSREWVVRGESLNVMFAAKNMEPEGGEAELRLWLCPAEGAPDWREAAATVHEMPGKTITHVYMQIGAQAFLPEFWDGRVYEEFLLLCAEAPPAGEPNKNCTALLFVREAPCNIG